VLLYDWVFVRPRGLKPAVGSGPVADAPGSDSATMWHRWRLYVGLAATWGVLWMCGIAPAVLGRSDGVSHVGFSYRGVTSLTYAAAQPGVIVKYLQLSFWPASLCLDYAWPAAATWREIAPPAIVVAILLAATGWALWRRSWMGLAGAWFFVILAPTSSVVPIKDLMFEHRMYLPLAAVIALTVITLRTILHELCMRARLSVLTRRIIATVLLLNAAASLVCGTIRRNANYADDLTMWKDVVAKRPNNARAFVAVGNALAARDRIDEAVEVTREAMRIDSEYADGHCALGIVLMRQGKPDEAIDAYREALRLNPLHAKAWYSLGNALDRQGRYDEAVDAFTNSIEAYSGFADAHCNLGNTLVRQGRIDEGVEAFRKTLAINPRHVKGHNNLGDAWVKLGRLDEAAAEFETAIRLQPGYAKARINLALVRVTQRLYAEAIEQCEAVLRLDPNNPTAQDVLVKARAADGQQ
ncbi:MAG: tetratricopeptide repeat protein, partial [Phycisphaerales bacterium]|nr:tetratricopeptide repeat protein [Phycisphaerales bacterium]